MIVVEMMLGFFKNFFFNDNKKKLYYQNEKLNLIYTLNIWIQKR